MAQTVLLRTPRDRATARSLIDCAPEGAVVTIKEAKRTTDQNALLWAVLSEISRAKPEGRCHTTEVWKALFMNACGHAVQFEVGLSGQPFPVGFRSSRLTKSQFSDLIEFIYSWCAEKGVIINEVRHA